MGGRSITPLSLNSHEICTIHAALYISLITSYAALQVQTSSPKVACPRSTTCFLDQYHKMVGLSSPVERLALDLIGKARCLVYGSILASHQSPRLDKHNKFLSFNPRLYPHRHSFNRNNIFIMLLRKTILALLVAGGVTTARPSA